MGVLHRQQRPTFCSRGSCLKMIPEPSMILGYLLLGLIYGEASVWPGDLRQPAAAVYGLAEREVMLHPPSYVLLISKGADHDESGAKACVHDRVGEHRNVVVEYGNPDGLADVFLVTLIFGIHSYGHAGGQELGPGGGDLYMAVFGWKTHVVQS